MEVILFESVLNLGTIGDRVNVKPGYARNYLIPQGKAVPATAENVAALETRRVELEKQEAEIVAAAQAKVQKLEGLAVEIAQMCGDEGKLFGSVGTQDIVSAVAEAGVEIARHDVHMPEGAIRQTGEYDIEVQLHSDVSTSIKVTVVPETQ
jgi:large subunit ribosomal protein L9